MNRAELRQAFDEAGVPPGYYNLYDRPLTDGTWAMWPDGDGWHVYYAEHGIVSPEARFDSEADACRQLWEWLAWARKDTAKQLGTEPPTPDAPETPAPDRRSWWRPWRR